MKKNIAIVVSIIVVVAFACCINWEYITKLLDLERRAAMEIASANGEASKELKEELDTMTASKFFKFNIADIFVKPTEPQPSPGVSPTPDPSDDFDIKLVHDKLKTDSGTAFFWSGTTTDKSGNKWGGQDRAKEIAESMGGVTLEMVMDQNDVDPPKWDPNDPVSEKNWKDISEAYAEQASGEVWGVIGQDLREDNIWENLECVTLLNNPDVTKITLIDPYTMEEKVLLER